VFFGQLAVGGGLPSALCARGLFAFSVTLCLAGAVNADEAREFELNIPRQNVETALDELATQVGAMLLFPYDSVQSVNSNAVIGRYTIAQALDILLRDTRLAGGFTEGGVITISHTQLAEAQEEPKGEDMNVKKKAGLGALLTGLFSVGANAQEPVETDEAEVVLEEIVVTGSNIRGAYPESSPLFVYSAEEIRQSGALTTEQFFHTLPQNLNSLVSSAIGALGGAGEANESSVNSIDLRGLGVGTTLILMNGRRIASSSNGRAPDVSLIPLAAIDRVEVLTDGASAIYGSDAVGGVVNFILKDHFDGVETTIGYGSVTDGSHSQVRFDQSFGSSWNRGNGLLSYSYVDQSDLDALDRDFASAAAPFTLIPDDRRHNVLATITQELGAFDASADFLFSTRDTKSELTQTAGASRFLIFENRQDQIFANIALSREYSDNLYVSGVVTYSTADLKSNRSIFDASAGDDFNVLTSDTETVEGTIAASGSLFDMSGGAVKYAVGAGYSSDELSSSNADTMNLVVKLDRDTRYAFAELLIPITQPSQSVSGLNRLEISLANRFTDYSDFGSNSSPKVGVLWSPLAGLNLRGTYAESFRAPFLFQTNPNTQQFSIFSLAAFGIPDPFTTDDSTILFFATGSGNPNLQPEEAQSYTAGFDFSPLSAPELTIGATYFNIQYTDQISVGDASGGFAAIFAPDEFPDLFILDPSEEFIQSVIASGEPNLIFEVVDVTDAAAIAVLTNVALDNRVRNLSISEVSGIDVNFAHRIETETGSVDYGANVSRVIDSIQKITATSPEVTLVDTLLNPASLKLTGYVGYTTGGFSIRGTINYVDGYSNPFSTDNPDIDSWTVVNVATAYSFSDTGGFFGGTRLSLNIRNLLDKDPPFVDQADVTNTGLNEPIGYDPTNANPLGRFVSVEISKRW